jgi:hypothetical protein
MSLHDAINSEQSIRFEETSLASRCSTLTDACDQHALAAAGNQPQS